MKAFESVIEQEFAAPAAAELAAVFGGLGDLHRLRDATRRRESSWDTSGGNADFWLIGAGRDAHTR